MIDAHLRLPASEPPAPALPTILYVDDEANALKYFQRAIAPLAEVLTAMSVEEGKRILDENAGRISVLVSDQRMPGAYGNELLSYAWDRYPDIVRILTTAYSEIEHTVEAVNQGQIHRYIQKPWDIAALRMELKQALALAQLRSEHAQLLREKLLVRQRQAVANRIGALYALCASLAGPEQQLPVEAYLSAALTAGVTPPEPDWLLMDYADLVSSEAFRSTAFGAAVRLQLDIIERDYAGRGVEPAFELLQAAFGASLQQAGSSALFLEAGKLTEFLETPTGSAVSHAHASWLAILLWLARRGWALQLSRSEQGLQGRLAQAEPALTPNHLAAWIEHF
ncbi:response regulator [Janthinobacterium aquaticum]|uniref:response regulator n=1 Tax=Janthinobacterium sp. FT58W TaxID=2654254 RepID=UPI0012654BD0|nr:response regulator [Janthinobacterium sp. FT58W]KAB8041639.1 response regulator [Janthinobacterium sp. FT58W]